MLVEPLTEVRVFGKRAPGMSRSHKVSIFGVVVDGLATNHWQYRSFGLRVSFSARKIYAFQGRGFDLHGSTINFKPLLSTLELSFKDCQVVKTTICLHGCGRRRNRFCNYPQDIYRRYSSYDLVLENVYLHLLGAVLPIYHLSTNITFPHRNRFDSTLDPYWSSLAPCEMNLFGRTMHLHT